MAPHHHRRRVVLIPLALTVGLALSVASSAGADATATTTGTTPPTPRLSLSWKVVKHECWTVTRKVRVRKGKMVRVEKKHKRICGNRAVKARGRALHLRWRQHGDVFGHLTLAGQPIANATVTVSWTIPHWPGGSTNLVTNAKGRFSAPIYGPAHFVTVSYTPSPGVEVAHTKKVDAAAHLSLKVAHLKAGHRGRFSGIVFGGHIPEDLYVQFWYYAGSAGWQPFSHLALVSRRNGHWAANVPIPRAAAGYTYRIKASVVPSPDWPWAHTDSAIVVRHVS